MADRNANILVSLRSPATPELRQLVAANLELIGSLQKSGATLAQAEQHMLGLAQAAARTQKATGDLEGSERTLTAALVVASTESKQLYSAQTQLANAQKGGADLAAEFGSALKGGLLGVVGPAAAATAAITALKGAIDLTVAGENINRVDRSFQNLAQQAGTSGNAILAALRKASGGEISDLNLELATDKGLLLGVANTAQQFADIMEIARDRAAKMGITTTQAYDDITTGIGRESPRILDNLGIIVDADAAHKAYADSVGKAVDQLTKAERIEALRNAVIAQGKGTLDAATTAANDQANGFARLSASWDNIKNKAGSAAAQGVEPFVTSLSGLLNASDGSAEGTRALIDAGEDLSRTLAGLPPRTAAQIDAQRDWTKSVQDWIIAREVQLGLINAQPTGGGGGGTFEFNKGVDFAHVYTTAASAAAQASQDAATKVQFFSQAADISAQKSTLDAAAKDAQQAKTALVNAETKKAADAFLALNPTMSASQAFAAAVAQGLGDVTAQVIAFRIEANKAKSDLAGLTTTDPNAALKAGLSAYRSGSIRTANDISDANTQIALKAADDARRLEDLQNQNRLINAKTTAAKIAELQRQQRATSDPIERQQLQNQIDQERNSAAKAHTSELDKQLKLGESIYDSTEKQKQAVIDLGVAEARNRLDTLKDQDELKKANAILNSSGASENLKARAQAKKDLILAEEAKRDFEQQQLKATANASLINGKLYQSVPGDGTKLPGATGAQAGAAPAGRATTGAAGATAQAGGQAQVVFVLTTDAGQILAKAIGPEIYADLYGAIQHAAISQGAGA